jgi:ABC-type transport system involved in multi-copper enzyme maturation permease subunit
MFKTLLIKEWKERTLVALFGLGLMIVLLAAFLILGDSRDFRDLIPAGFLFIFPFLGLILGAGAFESELRNDSWAYLLSRPVRKETIWLAKLTALMSIMAGFWLVFLGLMAAVPSLGEVVAGYRFPEVFEAGLEFLPMILLSSVFYFSIAFSLSILSERQFSLVFGSLFLGFALQGVLTYFAFLAEGRGLLSHAGRFPWLDAYKLALVLSSLAFLGASLITFRKADFSQPKRKAVSLAKYSLLFLALAWLLAAAWPAVRPGPKEELSYGMDVVGSDAFFSTTRGLYRYDVARDKVSRLVRGPFFDNGRYVIGGGKILYTIFKPKDADFVLHVMNIDGSGKRQVLGDGKDEALIPAWFNGFALSPDGKTAIILHEQVEKPSRRGIYRRTIWSVRIDGTGFKKLPPLDPVLAGNGKEHSWLWIVAWPATSGGLLLRAGSAEGGAGLWTYDPATGAQARLFEGPRVATGPVSPGGDALVIAHRAEVKGPLEILLLDIPSGEKTSVMKIESPEASTWGIANAVWSRTGDRVAFLVRKGRGVFTVAVYSRPERRLIEAMNSSSEEPLPQTPSSLSPSIGWISKDSRLVLGVPQERCLKVLSPDLAVEKKLPVPSGFGKSYHVWAAGDAVLVEDFENEAIWRLDLETEKWKKVR